MAKSGTDHRKYNLYLKEIKLSDRLIIVKDYIRSKTPRHIWQQFTHGISKYIIATELVCTG